MTGGAWFHASKTIIKRSEGRSVVAAAAYRTASSLTCERERTTHDYTRKRGVAEVFTTVPEGKTGLEWAQDIPRLTNAMEASEKRKDAQLGHEWTIALPAELDDAQRSALAHAMAQKLSDLYGVAVIGAIHRPGGQGDQRNHHVHLLFTTREVEADGKLGVKVTSLTGLKTGPQEVKRFRQIAADLINDALTDAGSAERVSPLSFEARGIDRVPGEHLGPSASEMERRNPGSSDRGDMNREIAARNQALDALVVELVAVDAEIAQLEEERLDARYGAPEPDSAEIPDTRIILREPEPATPRETLEVSFHAALGPVIEAVERLETAGIREAVNLFDAADIFEAMPIADAVDLRQAPAWTAPLSFGAMIHPMIVSVKETGETWLGARLWQKAAELYQRGVEGAAEIGRDVLNQLQHLMRSDTTTPDREIPGYWQRFVDREPDNGRDGPER